ncbi:estradiol 17-beta-dehydrogenase 2 [Platichthys flesus]|uniref:estradiol 17-beta-dehydrogenase 2 n=1 Tax=Platichthys flesus TaxID=8260 RepID=UPI002DBF9ECA|nr:estradiol 17-beta-dehydrogenase 2 [Platichthys flesus]
MMDVCFSLAAAGLYVLTVLWTLSRGHDAGHGASVPGAFGALLWPLGASLCYVVSPVLCGLVFLSCSVRLIWDRKRCELLLPETRGVLITGCDSGFGHALAKRLSLMGVKVFAGMLDVDGPGAQRLRETSENLHVLQLDVTDRHQVETVHRDICSQVGHTGLWGLVNNAGILQCPMDAELQPLSACRRCMDVNFLSAVNMCQVFLPLLRRAGGRIVNMSSMAAAVPMPMLSAYGASKAALSVFSHVTRVELSDWGVTVALIQPAGFRTNIFGTSDDVSHYRDQILEAASPEARRDYGDAYISSLPSGLSRLSQRSAEDLSPVLDDMCHALLSVHPKPLYTPGQMGWLLPFVHRHCPTAIFDVFIKTLTKYSDCEPAGLRTS